MTRTPEGQPSWHRALAANLRLLRRQQGLSLEWLAKATGLERAALEAIEAESGAPTIGMLWRIAKALDVPFAGLIGSGDGGGTAVIRRDEVPVLTSRDGRFTSRTLFASEAECRYEFYELRLAPGATEEAEPHAPGTMEVITVGQGAIEIVNGDGVHALGTGDVVVFVADAAHSYRNTGDDEALLYLVIAYADPAFA